MLAGDLNDTPDVVTTALLEGPADGDIDRADKGDAVRLYNLGRLLPSTRVRPCPTTPRSSLGSPIPERARPGARPCTERGRLDTARRRGRVVRARDPQTSDAG